MKMPFLSYEGSWLPSKRMASSSWVESSAIYGQSVGGARDAHVTVRMYAYVHNVVVPSKL